MRNDTGALRRAPVVVAARKQDSRVAEGGDGSCCALDAPVIGTLYISFAIPEFGTLSAMHEQDPTLSHEKTLAEF